MSLFISSVFTYDEDAGNYIQAVEAADAQALEPATRKAINNFVIGCKQDGIWTAIKASCILSGARTLAGALVPLVGTAPTNNGFIGIGTDYVRKTGLVGNSSTKYLDSNRADNADPQDSMHLSIYGTTVSTGPANYYIGSGTSTHIRTGNTRNRNAATDLAFTDAIGFKGTQRSTSSGFNFRISGATASATASSSAAAAQTHHIFKRADVNSQYIDARLAFYSIGESLDLTRLDARVTDLINAFAVTIP